MLQFTHNTITFALQLLCLNEVEYVQLNLKKITTKVNNVLVAFNILSAADYTRY